MTTLTPNYGPAYRPLDRLDGDDLTDWQRVPLFASARHFRKLHRLYGVADGLHVTVEPDGSTVVVSPGVAFDAYGRPMVSTAEEKLSVQSGFWIVLRGEKPAEQQLNLPVPAPQRSRVVVLSEANAIGKLMPWEIPLAKIRQESGKLTLDLSLRPVAVRTFRRPYVATGRVPSGTTAVALAHNRGWQVWVDTSEAGFLPLVSDVKTDSPFTQDAILANTSLAEHDREKRNETLGLPVYIVSVGRQTKDDAERFRTGQTALDGRDHFDIRPPLVTVSQATEKGFLLTVDYRKSLQDGPPISAIPLEVWWTGIEPRTPGNRTLDRKVDESEAFPVEQKILGQQMPWPEFRDEQRLTADDLNSVQQTIRQLQWIHNRTLHDWGVAEGCEVTVLASRRGVLIQRGYGIDVEGREVIVTDPVQLDVPAQKVSTGPLTRKTWWVTASYRDSPAPRNDGRCNHQGVPLRRLAEAAVRWRDPERNDKESRLEPGLDIILATVELDRGEVVDITPAGRRSAVPSKRPYVAAGRSTLKNQYNLQFDISSRVLTLTLTIETSSAGFVSPPHYLIQVETKKPSKRPNGLDEAVWKLIEPKWKSLLAAFDDSSVDFVAAVESRPVSLDVMASIRLAASTNGLALIRQLAHTDERNMSKSDRSPELQLLTLLKEKFLAAMPYQFAWFGIEV